MFIKGKFAGMFEKIMSIYFIQYTVGKRQLQFDIIYDSG